MHAIEKILAKHSGCDSVKTGEIVTAKIDFAEINDLYLQTVYSFYEMGGKKVWDNDKVAFVFDHYAPAPTIQSAKNQAEMRRFAKENALTHHFDINSGVCHQVMVESGVILPGRIILATDSHTTTHGALGAFGTGVGATDMATVLLTGELWLRVPEIIEIRIDGIPDKGVYPKDVVLYILGKMKADGAVYKAIDFTGSYVEQLNVAGRMVLCNMAVEMGAKAAYMQPNDEVLAYVEKVAAYPYQTETTDADFVYANSYRFDVSDLQPQVSIPHAVDRVADLCSVEGTKIDQGFVGACTGGRFEDIMQTAEILKGKRIPKFVRLVVIPASSQVLKKCIETGVLQDLIDAGATISTPGCGPCLGAHEGVISPGEVCITASNRNFPGRMGSTDAYRVRRRTLNRGFVSLQITKQHSQVSNRQTMSFRC